MFKKILFFIICIPVPLFGAKAPKLTVIIVIDQFSYHYLPKLKPYLTGGLKLLMDQGVNYTNTFYPHSMPGTCAGHTLLSTGTVGYYHGMVNNTWFNAQGKTIACDDDSVERAAVFGPKGALYTYGKSARNILVDNLSDQLMLYSYPHAHNNVWSLSIKSRAAIPMAGKLGKALWLDDSTGNFTSSLAYFKKLPEWVTRFNTEAPLNKLTQFIWEPFYPHNNPAYTFADISNYTYASMESMLGKALSINHQTKQGYDELYNKSPLANKHLIQFAQACIEENYTGKDTDRFILWLSLSSLDKVGHTYGPYSKEAIDMIYHMDAHLSTFIKYLSTKVDPHDTLLVLTADHGIQPIPELVRDKGLSLAKRYLYPELIQAMNTCIHKKYGIEAIVQNFKEPYFYLDQQKLSKVSKKEKKAILQDLKKFLQKLPGIRNAWTFKELQHTQFDTFDLDIYLKRQLYRGRSGQIIYSVLPYTTIDTHPKGTSHITSFTYDIQVPLIFYQPGRFERKTIVKNVYMTQVTPTLSQILSVPRPSTAIDAVLPGLYNGEEP